jgi:uncharacterized protein YjcR
MSSRTQAEERHTGEVWALIQQWMDAIPYPPSQAKLAGRVGVSPSTMSDWKYREGWPSPENMQALAAELGVPHERVLHAFLVDHGYRMPNAPLTRNA